MFSALTILQLHANQHNQTIKKSSTTPTLNQEYFRLAIFKSYLTNAVKTGNRNSGLSDVSHKIVHF